MTYTQNPTRQSVKHVKQVTCLADIEYPEKWAYGVADVIFKKLIYKGNPDSKTPVKFLVELATSHEELEVITWTYSIADAIKAYIGDGKTHKMFFDSGHFNYKTTSVRCTSIDGVSDRNQNVPPIKQSSVGINPAQQMSQQIQQPSVSMQQVPPQPQIKQPSVGVSAKQIQQIQYKQTNSLADIEYPDNKTHCQCTCRIISVNFDGNESKSQPIKFTVALEYTDERLDVITWTYTLLPTLKNAMTTNIIYNMTFESGLFGKTEKSVRCINLVATDKVAENVRNVTSVNTNELKQKVTHLIDRYVLDPDYRNILNRVMQNKFYTYPAATSIHHAFNGGLLLHSYTVAYMCLTMAKIYEGKVDLDLGLLCTGALLHDIGKIDEYDIDGNHTTSGVLLSHIASGISIITEACCALNIDPTLMKIKKLMHIIASHHGQKEYGSTNTPSTIEAEIVSLADNSDSKIQQFIEEINKMQTGAISGKIFTLDGTRIVKF